MINITSCPNHRCVNLLWHYSNEAQQYQHV